MKTFTFKTNINCGGCVAKVTPFLNAVKGIEQWNVDTSGKDKILETRISDEIEPQQIIQSLQEAGFKAEQLS